MAWICLGVLAACALPAASATAQPRLKIESKDRTWNVTDERPRGIPIGETIEHEFLLRNDGTEPLEILGAKPKDAFLTTVLPEEKIAPGGEARLKVVLNTEGLEPSQIEAHIVVESNDPASEAKPMVLTVKAWVIPKPEVLLVVEPQERNIGVVRVGQAKTLKYTYQNAGSKEFEIYPIYFTDKRFRIVENIERGVLRPGQKEFQLEFTARPEDAGKALDAFFLVKTDSEEQSRLVCRVRGYVAPEEKKPEGVQIIPKYYAISENPLYLFTIVNNTARLVEVVAMRGEEKLGTAVVEPEHSSKLSARVASEEELKEISFQVNLDYASPEPAEPEGEEAEIAPADGGTEEGETVEGEATEDEVPEGDAPADSNGETDTEPAGEGG